MRLTRAARSILVLAAVLLGLGPVHALVMETCESDAGLSIAMDGSGCDCAASGCQNGAPVFCGQCLIAVSAATSGLALPHPAARRVPALEHDGLLERALAPPVPPPKLTA
jgi:hypothetical protein